MLNKNFYHFLRLTLVTFTFIPYYLNAQTCTPPPAFTGRIAWTADGNESDRDEYLATPYMAAILQAANVELVHFAYNDQFLTRRDLSQNNGNVGNRPDVMRATVNRALAAYNSLGDQVFDCDGDETSTEAIAGLNHLAGLIETAGDPGATRLYICIAGGARYVGLALTRAKANGATIEDFQNVTVVSHSRANNLNSLVDFPGTDWDIGDIETEALPGGDFEGLVVANYANRGSIHNEELFVNVSNYQFIFDNQTRPLIAPIFRGFQDSRKPNFDPSDAGMAYIVLYFTDAINQTSARLIQPSDFVQEVRDLDSGDPFCGTVLSIADIEKEAIGIKIYPNPTTKNVVLDIKDNSINLKQLKIVLTDVTGSLININSTENQGKLIINLENLQQGVYFLNVVSNNNNSITKKIIVE